MSYKFPAILPAAVDRLARNVLRILGRLRAKFLCKIWGVDAGRGTVFIGKTYLRSRGQGIKIGEDVVFNASPRGNMVGLMGPTIIDNRQGGSIKIGKGSGFSSVVISSKSAVTIGERVLVGGNVRIFDHDFHSLDYRIRGTSNDFANAKTRSVIIEDDCFIGTNAVILKGSHIGARSIVAAGSVVFGLDIPPDSMVKGNPAKIVGARRG